MPPWWQLFHAHYTWWECSPYPLWGDISAGPNRLLLQGKLTGSVVLALVPTSRTVTLCWSVAEDDNSGQCHKHLQRSCHLLLWHATEWHLREWRAFDERLAASTSTSMSLSWPMASHCPHRSTAPTDTANALQMHGKVERTGPVVHTVLSSADVCARKWLQRDGGE